MATWFAFLRGINLGKRQVKMAELKTCLEGAGFTDIKTVVASGNVRLSAEGTETQIKARLETAIEAKFGFVVGVVLRSETELRTMLDSKPFASLDPKADATRHVLMSDGPLPQDVALPGMPGDTEILRVDARDLYVVGYVRPNGRYTEGVEEALKPLYARLGKGHLDTMRNWNTMEKMLP
jgi:uncharacterized protein (DUF1697 family)